MDGLGGAKIPEGLALAWSLLEVTIKNSPETSACISLVSPSQELSGRACQVRKVERFGHRI